MFRYTWFVSFMFRVGSGWGYGNMDLTTDFAPKDIDGVRKFEAAISDAVGSKVVIMFYTMLNIENMNDMMTERGEPTLPTESED